jgi:AraC-like DNA-binding protein
LTQVRLERAQRWLARGGSVTEACFEVGFSSLGSFSRLFAQRVGMAPRDWQRRVRTVLPSAELWAAVWIPSCYLLRHTPSTFGEALYALPRP